MVSLQPEKSSAATASQIFDVNSGLPFTSAGRAARHCLTSVGF